MIPLRVMRTLIFFLTLALSLMAQTTKSEFEWTGPCEVAGKLEICRIKFPVRIDNSTNIGTLELPVQAPPDVTGAVAVAVPSFLSSPAGQSAFTPLLPQLAALVAPLLPAPAPAPAPAASCPGPILTRATDTMFTIGASWSAQTPCKIPQVLSTGAGVELKAPLTVTVPAAGSCRGHVFVDKGILAFSAGACAVPGAYPYLPITGSHVLGYWASSAGVITYLASVVAPQLVNDSWTVQLDSAARAAAVSPLAVGQVIGRTDMGDGRTITTRARSAIQ